MEQEKVVSFQSSSSVVLGNCVFLTADNTGQLFCIDGNYSSLRYKGHINKAIIDGRMPQYRLCLNDDKVLMIPFYGERIGIYNKETDIIESVELPKSIKSQRIKFSGAFKIHNRIFCLPYYASDSVCILDSKQCSVENTSRLLGEQGKDFIINDIFLLDEGRVAGLLYGTQKLVIYDSREESVYIKNISNDEELKLHSCCVKKNIVYTKALNSDAVYEIDISNNDITEVVNTTIYNGKVYSVGDHYVVVDSYDNPDVFIIDTESKDKRYIEIDKRETGKRQEFYLGTAVLIDEKLYYISATQNTIYSYDEDKAYSYGIYEGDICKLREDIWRSKENIIRENGIFRIDDFIHGVLEGNNCENGF